MVTRPVSASIATLLTPDSFEMAFFTAILQPPHVIPVTIRIVSAIDLTSPVVSEMRADRYHRLNRKRRSSNELLTTDTELKAIAPAAMIGDRLPKAANGMPIVL